MQKCGLIRLQENLFGDLQFLQGEIWRMPVKLFLVKNTLQSEQFRIRFLV